MRETYPSAAAHYRFTLHAVGLDIGTRMEMVGAHLAEVGRIISRNVTQRKVVICRIEMLSRAPDD